MPTPARCSIPARRPDPGRHVATRIRVEAVEHVELGQRDGAVAGQPDAEADSHRVVPAAAPRPAGRCSVLDPSLAQALSLLVLELGRQRPRADRRGVRLGHAEDLVDGHRGQAGAQAGASGDRAGAGDVGIDAPVDVAHRSQLALEQDVLAARQRLVDQRLPVDDVRAQPLTGGQVVVGDPLLVEWRRRSPRASRPAAAGPEVALHDAAGARHGRRQPRPEAIGLHQVDHADATPRDLVDVGGTDAAAGRAELGRRPAHAPPAGRSGRGRA